MYRIATAAMIGLLLSSGSAAAVCSSYPNNLINGNVASASQVMANFNCAALTQGATLDSTTFTGATSFPGSTVINSSGNLGIGTASPGDILTISPAYTASAAFVSVSTIYAGPFFEGHELGSTYSTSSPVFKAVTDNAGTPTANFYYGGYTGSAENFWVRADGAGYFAGNVGIGTSSPGGNLDVYGAGNANAVRMNGSTSGNAPSLSMVGSDPNINFVLQSKGTGALYLQTGAGTQVAIPNTASAVDYLTLTGGATGAPGTVTVGATGTDSDINIAVTPKGAGDINLTPTTGKTAVTAGNFTVDGGAVAIGASSVTAGTALDLGSNNTASNSSLLLPGGSMRPTSGVNGMLRYNSSTPGVEAYVGGSWMALGSGGGGSTALSALTSATAVNPIDNANYAQSWSWNTLTTQTALTLSSSSETTGSLLALTNSNTAGAGPVLNASTASAGGATAVQGAASGTSGTNYGVYGSAASASGYGVYGANSASGGTGLIGVANSGAGVGVSGSTSSTTANATAVKGVASGSFGATYAGYFSNSSTNGWALYGAGTSPSYFAGRVGVGTTSPQAALDLGTGSITGGTNSAAYRNYIDIAGDPGFPSVDEIFQGGSLATGGFFRAAQASIAGTSDIFFQAVPLTTSGYGYLEAWNGAGLILGTGNGATPIIFKPNRIEVMRLTAAGALGIGTSAPTAGTVLDLGSNTTSMLLPVGTTAQRPGTGVNGMLRYNSSTPGPGVEAYVGGSWITLGSGGGGGSTALSSLTSATATNTIDNATFAQTWAWNTVTTQTALTLSSTSETTGSLLALTNSHTSGSGIVLSSSTASIGGATAIQGAASGTSGTNYGVYGSAASASGVGVYGTSSASAGTGISGVANSGAGIGVSGSTSSTTASATGVKGTASSSSGATFGIYGIAASTGTGTGIYGSETGANNTGYAVYGLNNSATGWGEYQAGTAPNYFAGSVGVGTTSPQAALDLGTGRITGGTYSGTYRNYIDVSGAPGFPSVDEVFPGGSLAVGGFFRAAQASIAGTNDIFFQAVPLTTSGYGYLEAWNGAGLILGTGNGATPIIFKPNRTEVMRLTAAGNLGIGTSTPAQKLEVNGEIKVDTLAGASATALCISAGVLSSCSSSIRYKENVESASFGLNEVLAMRPVTFKWKGRDENDFGLIAEEMAKINPLYVTYKDGRIEGVKYPQLTAVLVNAIKELKAANDRQSETIHKLQVVNNGQGHELRSLRRREASDIESLRTEVAFLRRSHGETTIKTAHQ